MSIDWLTDPLSQGFFTRAVIELLLLAPISGLLGIWLISFRSSYAAESLTHGSLPGIVLASLAGIPLGLGAAAGVLVAAGVTAVLSRGEKVGRDIAVAAVTTTLLSVGVLLALTPDSPPRLEDLLFGDPLGISQTDLIVAFALLVVGTGALLLRQRSLTLVAFDAQSAPTLGAKALLAELTVLVVLAISLAGAVQALGNLLTIAVLIAPAATAGKLTHTLSHRILLSIVIAALGSVIGLYLSYYIDMAAGAAVALTLVAMYLLAGLLANPRIWQRSRSRSTQPQPS